MTLTMNDTSIIKCFENNETLWANDNPTEYGVEVYTEGDCWALAWQLYLLALNEGYDPVIHTLGALNNWGHVVVEIEGSYWDVLGSHNEESLASSWSLKPYPMTDTDCSSLSNYMEVLDTGFVFTAGMEEAGLIARKVFERVTGWYQ